jgi:hypothetical protein
MLAFDSQAELPLPQAGAPVGDVSATSSSCSPTVQKQALGGVH